MSQFSDQQHRSYRTFVNNENMRHFTQTLANETDLAKRKIIEGLTLDHYERCLKPSDGHPDTKGR